MGARIKVRCEVTSNDDDKPMWSGPKIVVENSPIWTDRVRITVGDGKPVEVLGGDFIQAIRNAMHCDGFAA